MSSGTPFWPPSFVKGQDFDNVFSSMLTLFEISSTEGKSTWVKPRGQTCRVDEQKMGIYIYDITIWDNLTSQNTAKLNIHAGSRIFYGIFEL